MRRLLMLGNGGHARALAAALECMVNDFVHPDGLLDDDAVLTLDPSSCLLANGIGFVGGANRRREVHGRFTERDFSFLGVVHHTANIDTDVDVAADSQIMMGANLVAGSSVGTNSIINTGAIVDHGTHVGSHSHVASGAVLCGDVVVGDDVFIGAGAVVLPGVTVGDAAIVGAGSVVRRDVPPGVCVVGTPARLLRRTS